jgi:hypothetical protein
MRGGACALDDRCRFSTCGSAAESNGIADAHAFCADAIQCDADTNTFSECHSNTSSNGNAQPERFTNAQPFTNASVVCSSRIADANTEYFAHSVGSHALERHADSDAPAESHRLMTRG